MARYRSTHRASPLPYRIRVRWDHILTVVAFGAVLAAYLISAINSL